MSPAPLIIIPGHHCSTITNKLGAVTRPSPDWWPSTQLLLVTIIISATLQSSLYRVLIQGGPLQNILQYWHEFCDLPVAAPDSYFTLVSHSFSIQIIVSLIVWSMKMNELIVNMNIHNIRCCRYVVTNAILIILTTQPIAAMCQTKCAHNCQF